MLSLYNQIRAFVGLAILSGMALQVFAAKDGDVFRGTVTFQRSGDLYFFMETDAGAVWRVQRARNVPPVKRGDVVDVRGKKIGGIATPRIKADSVAVVGDDGVLRLCDWPEGAISCDITVCAYQWGADGGKVKTAKPVYATIRVMR